jgi:mannosyltransferase OCH1-like enzyme
MAINNLEQINASLLALPIIQKINGPPAQIQLPPPRPQIQRPPPTPQIQREPLRVQQQPPSPPILHLLKPIPQIQQPRPEIKPVKASPEIKEEPPPAEQMRRTQSRSPQIQLLKKIPEINEKPRPVQPRRRIQSPHPRQEIKASPLRSQSVPPPPRIQEPLPQQIQAALRIEQVFPQTRIQKAFLQQIQANNFIYNLPTVYESKIPLNLYQTWKTKKLSAEFQAIADTWKIHNPEYTYQLFDDTDAGEFIKDNFDDDVYDAFSKLKIGAFKADLFRYCVLYINGGVYADIDTICMNNLGSFLNNNIEFATPIDFNTNPSWGTYNLFNAFIASIPRHPILLDCINRVVYNVKNNIKPASSVDLTGPGVLGRATNVFLNLNETTSFVNKEGIINNILLLKFQQGTEYIKNNEGGIIFQNKNGNNYIKRIYDKESNRNNMNPDWDSEYSIRGV